jgi:hypothetical protein
MNKDKEDWKEGRKEERKKQSKEGYLGKYINYNASAAKRVETPQILHRDSPKGR